LGSWTHDTFGFSLALLEGMLVLELGSHGDGDEVGDEVGGRWW
jgi:hypothetical protein